MIASGNFEAKISDNLFAPPICPLKSGTILSKARFTKKKEEKISYLLVLSSIVSDCLEALGVEKWKNQLK